MQFHQVVGIARRVENIEELREQLSDEKGILYPVKCDLSNKDNILETFLWIDETLGPISILVNNAAMWNNSTLIGR